MTAAQKAYYFIINSLQEGLTIYIGTAYTCKKITPKLFAKWEQSGNKLFKLTDNHQLLIAAGKRFDCIASNNILLVSIKAYKE